MKSKLQELADTRKKSQNKQRRVHVVYAERINLTRLREFNS